MKKNYLLLLLCLATFMGRAQTIALNSGTEGGFEFGSTFSSNGWTVVNATTNAWVVGISAGSATGGNAAYISNDGSSYAYTLTGASTSHFYRDIAIPSGATGITLSFQWKGQGQSGMDRLLVYTAPTSVTPVANVPASSSTTLTGATLRYTQTSYTNSSTYTLATVTLPATLANSTVRLIFTWQNNSTFGTSPGAAVDDISLSYCATPAIGGPTSVCVGSDITLTNSETGGTWSSSAPTIGSINSATGVVTGIAAGSTTITYVSTTGCAKTTTITVKALPAAIGGTLNVCEGSTATITNVAGGTWLSGNTSVATISGTGVVTGVSAGSSAVTYTSSLGCTTNAVVTVNEQPDAISGTFVICGGTSTTLSSSPTTGMWTSNTITKATIGSTTGIMTGVAPGTSLISYTLPNGCRATKAVTINTLPALTTGTLLLCDASSVTLTNATTGGAWSSNNPSVASVNSTGIVTGTGTGNALISYTSTLGCSRVVEVTVNTAVAAIAGSSNLCTGTSHPLTNATPGGTWSSSAPTIASVVSTTGSATGVSAGTANITYTISAGCKSVATVVVDATPPANGGTNHVCEGGFIASVFNSVSGGTWSSSNPSIGSIANPTAPQVTGVAAGTITLTYTVYSNFECYRTSVFTVNATPGDITGSPIVCIGSTTTLIPATSGGSTWSSSNTAVATVGVTSGVVSGITVGTSVITYALTTGCYTTYVITANPTPSAITGSNSVCVGSTTTLSDVDGGGVWSSSNGGKASIGTASGIVYGANAGTSNISYTIAGCSATKIMSVNNVPASIGGTLVTCVGGSTTLTIATAGGTWSSGSPSIASVGTSGIVSGLSGGTATIYYTNAAGCSSNVTVTVNAATPSITGTTTVCPGATTALSIATTGGTWSSSSTAKATVNSSGLVTGVAAGTANITYTVSATCRTLTTVTVNTLPAAITGTLNVCVGQSTTITDATSGGAWSATSSLLTVGSSTGIVTGVTAGTTSITYTLPTGCRKTASFTVKSNPAAIAGTALLCAGATVNLTDPTPGGHSWTSSTPSIATIAGSGVVTGISPGTTMITYTLTSGCYTTKVVAVNPGANPITGTASVCLGNTRTLSSIDAGGTWSSSNTGVATIGSSTGLVTSVAAGTSVITYTLFSGCYVTTIFSVYPVPVTISGATALCVGSAATLSDATTGGSWLSSNDAIASVGTAGLVTANGIGNATISYVMPTGCYRNAAVTVSPAVPAITGAGSVCTGYSTALSNTTTGGTWSSSSTATATVAASTGLVIGVTPGTVTITYSLGTGCKATTPMTINLTPATITGPSAVCEASNITLSSATPGGAWSSSNTAVGTVSAGIVSGITSGTTTISYTLGSCYAAKSISVNALPLPITGTTFLCAGTQTVLSSATLSGASWTSSNPTVATIGITSGLVTALTGGTTNITYTTTSGCYTTKQVTVVSAPSAIGGTPQVCVGATRTLTNSISGGTWTSTTPTVATIGLSTGIVTGVSTGTTTITYSLGTSCIASVVVTVDALPNSITGTLSVCETFTTTLANTTPLGTWSSNTPGIATVVSGTGVVTGVSAGNTNISYTITATGCYRTANVSVNAQPGSVTGTATVCAGSTTTLSNSLSGGVWSSSNTAVGTVNSSTGVVAGISAGTTQITYTVGSCFATRVVSVNPLPNNITGTLSVCETFTTTLANTTPSGTWSSNTPAVATVVSSTGVVTGVSAGNANISYTITATGCFRTEQVTVNTQPTSITGTATVCEGNTTALSCTTSGGAWSSSNTAVGTVNAATGLVAGITAGTTEISYSIGSCYSTLVVTVSAIPNAISGTLTVCEGATATLTNTTPSGTWSSNTPSVATIVSGTGVMTGVAAGNATITYTTAAGCFITAQATVNTTPATITGASAVCEGSATTLSDGTTGGTWVSGSTGTATVGSATGLVTGVAAGNVNISYVMTATGCFATQAMTVNALPAAIGGTASVCEGSTTTLSNSTSGGTWSSSTPTVGTVNSSTGIVTGISAGNTTITYTVTATGCFQTIQVTVNQHPTAITGTATVCVNATTTLSSTPSGGVWSSNTPANGTIDASTGVLTGIASGNTTIIYTTTSGCTSTRVATVNPLPNAITGTQSVCVGLTTALGNTTPSGTWSSANTSTATVVSGTGVVTGVAAGNVNISYIITATGCARAAEVTVNANPGSITGTAVVCAGLTTTLSNSLTGGAWTSASANATVDGTTGVVTGVTAGTATISYSVAGCVVSRIVTVNAVPNAIGGTAAVCEGLSTTLTETTSLGTWTSSATGIATIGASGNPVTWNGIAQGNATITYTITANGCYTTKQVTVVPLPAAITPSTIIVCGANSTLALSSTTSGGTWASSLPAKGSIDATTGVLTALTAGTTTISYTVSGCRATTIATINALPTISNNNTICEGATNTLTGSPSGGTWISSSTSIATVGSSSGTVSGVLAGNATVTYTSVAGSASCLRTATLTINATPAISGTLSACAGLNATLTGTPSGGTWSSSNLTVGTISSGGVVHATTAGTTTISYTKGGCATAGEFTVSAAPASITGTANICVGTTSTLNDGTSGGTWTSSDNSIATVGSSDGLITGISGATGGSGSNVTITYTISSGCTKTWTMIIYPNPVASVRSGGGQLQVCTSNTMTLINSSGSGQLWSSSNTAVGTITPTGGSFTGLSAGTTNVTFTQVVGAGGCFSVVQATVNAASSAGTISGPSTVIVANQITLSSTVGTGGTWASGTTAVGTVNSAIGVVTGVSAGTTVITYTFNNGCGNATATYTVTVTTSKPGSGTVYGGANDPAFLANVSVYPNPNTGSFTIYGEWAAAQDEDVVVEVRDMLGRLVYNNKITSVKGGINEKVSLDASLAKGMYILTLRSQDRNATVHFAVGE